MLNIQPTPHQDINKILHLLLENIKEILKDQFIGMYLYGSLSSGDFQPQIQRHRFSRCHKRYTSREHRL